MTTPSRRILLVTHPGRLDAQRLAAGVATRLLAAGLGVCAPPDDLVGTPLADVAGVQASDGDPDASASIGCELVCVLGGDGTILRGAELSRGSGVPLLGVNLGHVGFLAEAEREDLDATVERIVARDYTVEERTTLEVRAEEDGHTVFSSWALNEVTVEKASRERMLELTVEIDGRPLSTWGCDGIVMATPTGSTAYAFSAGGPVVWPDVEALLLVPISAHALFARPDRRRPALAARRRGAAAHRRLGRRLVRRAARRRPAAGRPHRGAALRPAGAARAPVEQRVHRPARREVRPPGAGLARCPPVRRRRGPRDVIEEIRIRDLGVIDEAVLPLHPGLTVLTGETGAGKTMVVTGLGPAARWPR